MYLVVLSGGIGSGKSTVGRLLKGWGACRIDLDLLSREVTADGSPVLGELAAAFGADVLDETGSLRRDVLARRAFDTQEHTELLEGIVHPAIRELLARRIAETRQDVCVVEVPLLDRVEYLCDSADAVLCVTCPLEVRRLRAQARGMDADDFDARVAHQPSDDYLIARATHVLENDGSESELVLRLRTFWEALPVRGETA